MKIQTEKQLGLKFQEDISIRIHFLKIHFKKYMEAKPMDEMKPFVNEIIDFNLNPNRLEWETIFSKNKDLSHISCMADDLKFPVNKNFVFSQKAITIAKSIKIDLKKFDSVILSSLKQERMCTFLCGPNLAFKYWYRNKKLLGVIMVLNEHTGEFNYSNFRIDALNGTLTFPQDNPNIINWKETYFIQFLQLLFFLEFSDVEYRLLGPNKKYGTKREGNYLNATKKDITLVDSNWNFITINKNNFTVCGHLRFQAFGKELKERKLIFIEEFEKSGYIRRGKGTSDITQEEIDKNS